MGVANVKAEIPAHLGDKVGQWKGWEASGTLHGSIIGSGDKKNGKRWRSTIHVRRGSPAEKYALIHEVGGVIHAKTSNGMWFQGKNTSGANIGLINKMSVTIRPKRYFAKGREATVRQASQLASRGSF